MKKFFIWVVSTVLVLLTVIYLVINSSFLFEYFAKKFAPEYGFSYQAIGGNPLTGIKIDKLYYKDKLLSDEIRLHINPYLFLEGSFGVSRLELSGVDIDVLQMVIEDFSKPTITQRSKTNSVKSSTIPIGFELNNIYLSLKPFSMVGLDIEKEILSIDSIIFDGSRFIVGNLKQFAKTSLGDVELAGSYHQRILNLSLLKIDDLKVEELITFISNISKSKSPKKENSKSTQKSSSNIFIPKRVIADKLIFKMLPYRVSKLNFYAVGLNGNSIDIDLQKMIFNRANLYLTTQSNIGNLNIDLSCKDDECIANDIDIRRLNIKDILELSKSGSDKNKTKTIIADIPFVPDVVDIKHGSIKLLSQKLYGIEYDNAKIDIKDLYINLRSEKLRIARADSHIDTEVGSSDISLSIAKDKIVVDNLNISSVDIEKLLSLKAIKAEDKNSTTKRVASNSKIPYIPQKLLLKSAKVSIKPYKTKDIDINRALLLAKDTLLDISNMSFDKGLGRVFVDTNLAKIDISSIFEGRGLLIDADKSVIVLKDALMKQYKIPLKAKNISPIRLAGSVDRDSVVFDISTFGKDIYDDKNSSLKLDLNRLVYSGEYNISKASLKSHLIMLADIPTIVEGIRLNSDIKYSKKDAISYQGKIDIAQLIKAPQEIKSLIKGANIKFSGDKDYLKATLDSAKLRGNIVSKDMKVAKLILKTKGKIRLKDISLKLPKEFKSGWISMQISSNIDIKKPLPIKLRVTEQSNIANLKAYISYDKAPSVDATIDIPKYSLLNKFDKNLHLKGLSPLKVSIKPINDTLKLKISSAILNSTSEYNIKSKSIKGKIILADTSADISGNIDGDISVALNSTSLKKLMQNLSRVYSFKSPNIDGNLNIKLTRNKDGNLKATILSKEFIPNTKARVKNPIRDLKLSLYADMKKKLYYIDNYSLKVSDMKIFATKRSKITIKKDNILVDKFWINDSMTIKGKYNLKKQKGKFDIKASKFKIAHKNAKITISTDLKLLLNKDKVSIDGKVKILGGRVFYNLSATHYASDDDIIILQHRKEKNDSFFIKNVKLNILLDTKKPLLFKQKDIKIKLKPSMSIIKEYNAPLMVLGSIDLKKGGYYKFEGKKFVLEKSSIYFTGKPTAPLLNIRLVYRRYGKTIWITVSGTGTEPALNFSSSPYMSRDQILSFILFDTPNSGSSSEDMLSLVGGGLAKSILSNMGLKIDTLVLSQKGFEVGKRISNKVSIIYDQEDESKVIVRIEHSPKVETEISIGQDSQSVDIIYKREY